MDWLTGFLIGIVVAEGIGLVALLTVTHVQRTGYQRGYDEGHEDGWWGGKADEHRRSERQMNGAYKKVSR